MTAVAGPGRDAAVDPVGRRRATLESTRLVQGRGRYVANQRPLGTLEAALVRSPHAHARIVSIDVSQARAVPGVHAILTGPEAAELAGPIFTLADLHAPPLPIPMRALAHDKVRFEGEGVVAIAATSRAIAEDAAELVRVEYEPLPALTTFEAALADGAPRVHEGLPGNRILERVYAFGDVDGTFAQADRIVRRTLRWSRHTGVALDTFGCVAEWVEGDGVTLWSNHQSHALLWKLGDALGLPAHRVRGVPLDVGGAFGNKFWQPRPLVFCALLSRMTGRPVRFVEDRVEHLVAGDNHGEERLYRAELAVGDDGIMRGLRFEVLDDFGAALVLGTTGTSESLAQATGPYGIEAVGIDFVGVTTNKTSQSAYRGFGGAAVNFMVERMVDAAARELGVSRMELRERNLLQPEQFPYRTPTGNLYDSGDYPEAMRRAKEILAREGWLERAAAGPRDGKAIGVGFVTCQERSVQGGSALWLLYDQSHERLSTCAETVTARLDQLGNLRLALHSPSLGTPTDTVAATVAAAELGIRPEDVHVSRLDTAVAGPALGPAASRLTVMIAGAVAGAMQELQEAMRPIAADLLGVAGDELAWDRARVGFAVAADPERFAALARITHRATSQGLRLPAGVRSGLEATYTYDTPAATLPPSASDWGVYAPITGHAVHVPVVEVDVETGEVRFLAYHVVHDCGTVLNPDAVRGQVIGAICQGIGCALGEELTYDERGAQRQRDFRSYFVPTTLDMPPIDLHHLETPSPFTWRGVKGVGEGGRMAAPAAVVAAIEDALAPWDVAIDEIPVTPEKVLGWIADAPERR